MIYHKAMVSIPIIIKIPSFKILCIEICHYTGTGHLEPLSSLHSSPVSQLYEIKL